MKNKLTLYYFPSCPFCVRVLNHMKHNNIDIPKKDIMSDSHARAELMKIGGKTQVPCLVIDGEPLYESLDIINWIDENLL